MRRAKLLALVALFGGLVSTVVGYVPDATGAAGESVAMDGPGRQQTVTGTVGEQVDHTCTGLDDPVCPTHSVTITNGPVVLTGTLGGGASTDDFDLYLYTGNEVAAGSGSPAGTLERIDAVLHDGTYTVLVQPYVSAEGSTYRLDLSTAVPAPTGTFVVPTTGGATSFEQPVPSGSPSPADITSTRLLASCAGNASPRCDLFRIDVPFAGAQIRVVDAAMAPGASELASRLYDGRHHLIASNTYVDGDDTILANLPGAGTYYVGIEPTVAVTADRYRLDIDVTPAPSGGGATVSPDPGPQPADAGLFTRTLGFATKTGYRGVVAWQAAQPVVATVHYGTAPGALDLTAPAPASPDSAGMLVLEGLEQGRVYYWQVEDLVSGERSVVKSFTSNNAYTDWNGAAYTIDLVVQLDTEAVPLVNVPHDLNLDDLAAGMNVFAERIYDATDGFVRIGNVLVTDTNVDYAANVPASPGSVVNGECTPTNYADVLVQTSVPFDSHTYGYAIADACTSFYLGRLGQLVYEWQHDLHLGYVAAHELSHYALGAPDLYDTASGAVTDTGCINNELDLSLMNNTGAWDAAAHRWRLTEFDRNPTLTPCDHQHDSAYTWDRMRERYLGVPLLPDGPIEHIVDTNARGNEDGGALAVSILDREPGISTLTSYTPDDTDAPVVPPCPSSGPQLTDPAGDATELAATGPTPVPNDDGLDVVTGEVTSSSSKRRGLELQFTIGVVDVDAPPAAPDGNYFRFYFTHDGVERQVTAQRRPDGTAEFALNPRSSTPPSGTAAPLSGTIDTATNQITILLPAALVSATDPAVGPIGDGTVLSDLHVLAQRDTGVLLLQADSAATDCNYTVAVSKKPGGRRT